jgi:hypothetical protein
MTEDERKTIACAMADDLDDWLLGHWQGKSFDLATHALRMVLLRYTAIEWNSDKRAAAGVLSRLYGAFADGRQLHLVNN